ncbi:type IV toxin-antitoxin system AbiEi family antitoxin domain-containing protein [Nocardia sp. alder85J]|uniref:type IV toxin-antitoxin system AbiEi family antitoxin domain-containing protein n=1 Tax=Nocardia sp. alder85J TaxID=2862949 RepID=UPI001CD4FA43|nr:type IV toxin-antitoxin system AbiEi family antitoxin domain-containing protein [Nocardia sp. alder85J]MCX4097859.1 type IV toxin-antitoxin system AbiEi family antitoxin domain-containing protein [Nocardia sp. alder85J]
MATPQSISRRAALAAGLSDTDLHRLCRHGLWHRLRAGHYLPAPAAAVPAPERHRLLVHATVASASDSAVVSHVSAAVLHGLPVWRLRLDRAHLTRNRRNGGRRGTRLMVHSALLEPAEITVVDGVRCTTVARTLIDLARTEPFEQSVVCGDGALRRGSATGAQLRDQLRRLDNRPGHRNAAAVVRFLDRRAESVGESRSRVVLRQAGFPPPELQARILSPEAGFVARVDFLFPNIGVIGEFDGDPPGCTLPRRSPGSGSAAAEHRETRLRELGWAVARWTWDELDEPGLVARRIETAAAQALGKQRSGRWLPSPRR